CMALAMTWLSQTDSISPSRVGRQPRLVRRYRLIVRGRLNRFKHRRVRSRPNLIDIENESAEDNQQRGGESEDLSAAPLLHQRCQQRRSRAGLFNSAQNPGLKGVQERLGELRRLACAQPALTLSVLVSQPVASATPV